MAGPTSLECGIGLGESGNVDFVSMLERAWASADSLLCVGLDPDPSRLPGPFHAGTDRLLRFCSAIADATADIACAFKPQIAYFAAHRAEGQLEALIAQLHDRHPQVPVVLDAKRGDIGSTAEQYAREAFERYRADAVTVNPYLGFDSIEPYLAYPDKGVFLLCRTSNPGGADLRGLDVGGERLYERLARLAAGQWNAGGQIGLVVGATYPQELARVRAIVGDMPLLVPGVGAQGADIEACVRAGADSRAGGMLVNSARAILYASAGDDFAQAAREVALRTRNALNAARRALR
ncbi:MAG: orotidine-5'-phosphate decarboxylase [Burkholderiales bacterium]|nr:MAG: orotidine-5'-phosphate decarboxylase [Burkholderiales bacterium]